MQNAEQMLITTGIYFLTGLTLTIHYNYLKPKPIKKWQVAILIVVKVVSIDRKRTQNYVLLCDQMRVASGGRRTEICAGMMDDAGDITSVVLKEVKEETEFDIKNKRDLMELGSIFPSPGREEIFLYSWETTISEDIFKEKQRRIFGNASEGEEIKLSFVAMDELELKLMDVKAECAFRRYQRTN